jgi:hypothetical protein
MMGNRLVCHGGSLIAPSWMIRHWLTVRQRAHRVAMPMAEHGFVGDSCVGAIGDRRFPIAALLVR